MFTSILKALSIATVSAQLTSHQLKQDSDTVKWTKFVSGYTAGLSVEVASQWPNAPCLSESADYIWDFYMLYYLYVNRDPNELDMYIKYAPYLLSIALTYKNGECFSQQGDEVPMPVLPPSDDDNAADDTAAEDDTTIQDDSVDDAASEDDTDY